MARDGEQSHMELSQDDLINQNRAIAASIQRVKPALDAWGEMHFNLAGLEERGIALRRNWELFSAVHWQIVRDPTSAKRTYIINREYEAVEEIYLTTISYITSWMRQLQPPPLTPAPRSQDNQRQTPAYRLPKINLPMFSGSVLEWENFKAQFEAVVDQDVTLTAIQKLVCLKGQLTGEAAELVTNIELTDASYAAAWNDLKQRYGNTRMVCQFQMKALIEVAPAASRDPGEIRRLINSFTRARRSFQNLQKPVEHWDDWFVFLLTSKLDSDTRMDWERTLTSGNQQRSLDDLLAFLENRQQVLATMGTPSFAAKPQGESRRPQRTVATVNTATPTPTSRPRCPLCAQAHHLYQCQVFRAASPTERRKTVTDKNCCFNCLALGHRTNGCPSSRRCRTCSGRHHTMLHETSSRTPRSSNAAQSARVNHVGAAPQASVTNTPSSALEGLDPRDDPCGDRQPGSFVGHVTGGAVLLATAQVRLIGAQQDQVARALLDTCSQATLIRRSVASVLGLKPFKDVLTLADFQGANQVDVSQSIFLRFSAVNGGPEFATVAHLVERLSSSLPEQPIDTRSWPHLQGISLADPEFSLPAGIDIILGADICGELFSGRKISGPPGTPLALETALGYVVLGPTDDRQISARICLAVASHPEQDISAALRKFWEVEEIQMPRPLDPEHEICERHFLDTHSRISTGRYQVRLPFRSQSEHSFPGSRSVALRMLFAMERRAARTPGLHKKYAEFIQDMLDLKHLEVWTDRKSEPAYFIPHHAIPRQHDSLGRIRVVFNASAKAASGKSLNDEMYAGPKLQEDLWVVTLRWRFFKAVVAADIEKMYRQILLDPADRRFHAILFRFSPKEPIITYVINTVIYGEGPAAFLALRVLEQLIHDEGAKFPSAVTVVRLNRYIDDFMFGADSEPELVAIKQQLIALLASGGFQLAKWASNLPSLCPDMDQERIFRDAESVNALGLRWFPATDSLAMSAKLPEPVGDFSRRQVLAAISSFFDTHGMHSPVSVLGKIFMQDLWLVGKSWDDRLSPELLQRWIWILEQFKLATETRIPRWIGFVRGCEVVLHGFSDASSRAYAAAVYVVILRDGTPATSSLLMAKTRVAPIKTISIPRLELCAAALLAELISSVRQKVSVEIAEVHAWTDSQVTLTWIQGHASRWKTFVSNRVAQIQSLLEMGAWKYVPTDQNPADLASRGVAALILAHSALWWQGPNWLIQASDHWPKQPVGNSAAAFKEGKSTLVQAVAVQPEPFIRALVRRYSSWSRLIRAVAWWRRFIAVFRDRDRRQRRPDPFLTVRELNEARDTILRRFQEIDLPKEVIRLRLQAPLPARSSILNLRPRLIDGLLRVGGRIQRSSASFNQKHPIIVSTKSEIAELIVRHAHLATLHGGNQLTMSYIRQKYWLVHGGNFTRSIVRQCVTCARFRGQNPQPVMASLPHHRVTQSRPFLHSGVDFAGPLQVAALRGRGHKTVKAYICVFVCCATKAIHLELAMDLSAEGFIRAFHRFVARRGRCSNLYSDNGTNFVGASVDLQQMFGDYQRFYEAHAALLAREGTTWVFIPPSAPHFGGLWEAGVKAAKRHLRRVIGDQILSFEEMCTFLCQVEACLNSRPLIPLSADPDDLDPLTPGHFLIGEPTNAVPEPSALELPSVTLFKNRHLLVQQMRDSFWRVWSTDYLNSLQQLQKWTRDCPSIQLNTLVLVKSSTLPPSKWLMGRVIAVYPDSSGVVRSVKLRTKGGELERPVVKLVPLPVPVEP